MVYENPSSPTVQAVLASNLRRLRIARHLSLSELARATGMSKATLSGVESGRSNPTIDTLAALAGALRVTLTDLLEETRLDDVRVLRASASITAPQDGVGTRPLETITTAGRAQVTELALEPHTVREREPDAAGTRAHLYVIGGKLLAGPVERVTELAPGDYLAFPSDVPHVYETRRGPARALMITTASA